jgi:NAD(P)-dependent dehydrogenase (short-subunit alcohol dehydrogenase family)
MRGGKGFSAFASAKGALRMLAQSMARELGPQNIHVAHVIIDGGIDTAFIRNIRPDFDAAKGRRWHIVARCDCAAICCLAQATPQRMDA